MKPYHGLSPHPAMAAFQRACLIVECFERDQAALAEKVIGFAERAPVLRAARMQRAADDFVADLSEDLFGGSMPARLKIAAVEGNIMWLRKPGVAGPETMRPVPEHARKKRESAKIILWPGNGK